MKKVLYNGRMRTLHSGARGGHYVISSGRKVYLKVKSSSKKTGPKKKTSSALKKRTGPKKKTSSALKKKTGPKKKTSSALKKKTSPAKRKPGPKKKSKRGFRMPRLFKGGGEDIWEDITEILNPGITNVVETYGIEAPPNIKSIKKDMTECLKRFKQEKNVPHPTPTYVKWISLLKPTAVKHFKDVIQLTYLTSKYTNKEIDEAIEQIADFDTWHDYIYNRVI